MEATGLAIGIVSLYRACYDCYSFFTDVKKAEASSSSHMRELEIQQAILKSWGFHWQILSGDRTEAALPNDPKREPIKLNKYLLTNRHKAEAVFKTLSALFDTLSDQKKLGNRYGIQLKSTQFIKDESEFASSVELIIPDKAAVQVEPVITEVKNRLSVLTKFKWAMKDKDNFKKLITNLKAYGDTLYRLCPENAVPSMNIYFVMECVAGQESPAGLKWTSKLATEHADVDDDFAMRKAYQLLASAATLKASVNENRDKEDAIKGETLAAIEEIQPQMFYLGKGLALFEGQVVYVEMRDYRGPPLDLTPEQKKQVKEQEKKRRDRKKRRVQKAIAMRPATLKKARRLDRFAGDSSSLSEISELDSSSDDEAEDADPIQIIRPADPKLRALVKNFFNTFKGDNKMQSVQGLDIAGMIDHTEAEQKGHCSILYRLPGAAGVQTRERPAENLKIRAPVTLQSLLGKVKSGINSTLGARFRLARKLVRAVCLLHSSGWLHKNIRAQSVIFFPEQANGATMLDRRHEEETEIDVSKPILMGYIFSRPDDIVQATGNPSAPQSEDKKPFKNIGFREYLSELEQLESERVRERRHPYDSIVGFDMPGKTLLPKASNDLNASGFTLDYYQHPAKHADPNRSYRHAYDVYSLGILLLEVGIWEQLKSYKHSGGGDEDHYERRRWVCRTYLDRLRWACGDTYADVVLRCLMIDSSDDEVAKASERELCARIVADLENCQA